MEPIIIAGALGEKSIILEITRPFGSGGVYHIFIDRFYQGMIQRLNDQLVVHLNKGSDLTSDDILIVFDLIEENS